MINVDIVIPSYNGYTETKKLIESFKLQEKVSIGRIVVAITKSNFGNDNNLKLYCEKNSIFYFLVDKKEFSHSLVRERAIIDFCKSDIVVLMTQDAKIISNLSIYNLVIDIFNKEADYAFGRQICSKKKCIEGYIRNYNYPTKSYIISKKDIKQLQIRAFFASDVFAALNRGTFIKLGGYCKLNLTTNEDMFYMYSLLINGYKGEYCSNAIVEHYHKYNLKELYKRYFEIGKFFNKVKVFDKYNKNFSGFKLACYVLKQSILNFDIVSLFLWLPNMIARYFGVKRGYKNKHEY